MSAEGRRHARTSTPFEAQYKLAGDLMETWKTITTLDLSAVGFRFKSHDLVDVGMKIAVKMRLPHETEAVELRGSIMWSRPGDGGSTENGVEFLDTTPTQASQIDELVMFLNKSAPPQS